MIQMVLNSMRFSSIILPFPLLFQLLYLLKGFRGSSAGKESTCSIGEPSSIPGSGRSPWRRNRLPTPVFLAFPGGSDIKESICQCRRHKRPRLDSCIGKIPWRRAWKPTPVFLPGESHGQRSLAGQSMGSQRVRHD